ncbi:hybrid sensor histidine kinase/response regulator [Mucilaginibacter sp. KACC 22063]|uniref:hybrid sensor histidine kinase/response regulator n=1 Tax=Mucilaginibacter sp. KACC 22063 TaxID=3025666 RepID=UPI002366C6A8|nr:response regulator [Mucilaginibacter sp. KACC 22063]WDF57065.1 response regulator [Mucilaginibacter sp. KACC 22063]
MSPINILIVDDREENIIALEALLNRDDINLFTTTSPNEALKIAWDNSISIALVDVQMPEMDGFELVEVLKSNPRTRDILVLFVTAISKETKYAVKGLGTGAVDYLFKPLDPYVTSAKVDSFIQLARTQLDLKQKNEELQNYAIVVKNSADIICTVNAETLRILTINPAVEKITGYKPASLLGKSISMLAQQEETDLFEKHLRAVVTDRTAFGCFECKFETLSHEVKWIECRVAYRNGTLFINISDITNQKNFQSDLIRSKEIAEYARKVKERFLANMSHELRTPVNGIMGITDMLSKSDLNAQQQNMVNLLGTTSQSLLGVINDVLDISKIEEGKFRIVRTPGNTRSIIQSVVDLLKYKADGKDINLELHIDQGVPEYIMVDSLRLNQILMNLLSNAIKFTEKGWVKLSVKVLESHQDKSKIEFCIEDTGIGIAQDRIDRIFDSFEQADDDTAAKYGGTGLGLAIVKKLIELKGGELKVSSKPGKGSLFCFTNWYAEAEQIKDSRPKPSVKSLAPFENVRVLVAEDNLVNQFMLSKILKDWHVTIEMVDNGQKALNKLEEEDFDLILMDTHMPEMDGYTAARLIRHKFDEPKSSIPIISLSAASFDHEQEEALQSGMNEVLAKPFQPYQLHDKMSKLLRMKV